MSHQRKEPRQRKPFWKATHNCFYVQLDGKQIRLDPDRKAAFEKFEELKYQRARARETTAASEAAGITLVSLADRYFSTGLFGKAKRTRTFNEQKIIPLCRHLGPDFPASDLNSLILQEWIARHSHWSAGNARAIWQAVKSMCAWGMRSGLIPRLSLLDHRKPAASRREVVISPEQFEKLRGLVKNPAFGALLDFAWETGARPQELFLMEVQHLDAANQRIVLPVSKSKGKGKPRIVILTKKSLEIAVKASGERQQGPIFRNTKGKAWNAFSANLAFQMLRKRMAMENIPEPTDDDIQIFIANVSPTVRQGGVERTRTPAEKIAQAKIKFKADAARRLAPKYCLYHLRHSWLDRILKSGTDSLTAAILMGHSDPSMVAKTYQHLSHSPEYLRAALEKATETRHE